jgi:anaerobic selenocysteine-containing dehydrogenase
MEKGLMSRRSFMKATAATVAATALATSASGLTANTAEAATSDEPEIKRVRTCCRGCGKMECGVWVTVENGRAVKIEGDESAFQSNGNCCTKSQASLQAAYHPDRLYHPLKRTNPKGEDPGWVRISWDEAYETVGTKFNELIDKYGAECLTTLCGTSRIWPMGGYAGMKIIMGTPNCVGASQICKGPRHFVGQLVDQLGSPWMATVEQPRVYLQWGTAVEASNYDDSGRTAVDAASHADVHILVDPREGGLGKEADYWLQIRPGTDMAVALAWEKIIIENNLYDELFVKRWSNAPMLVVEDMEPSGGWILDGSGGIRMKTKLLKESDLVEGGSYKRFMVWDKTKAAAGATGNDALSYLDAETTQWEGENYVAPTLDECTYLEQYNAYMPPESTFDSIEPALDGEYEVTLKDGSVHKARPVWTYLVDSLKDCTPEWASEITGVDADLIEEACLVWATRPEGQPYGNGGIHFQLATDQTGACVQTIRCLMYLTYLTGNADSPAGNRGPTRAPALGAFSPSPEVPLYPQMMVWPYEDMTYDEINAKNVSADKFPMNKWYAQWSDATCTWRAAIDGEPYKIRGGHDSGSTYMNQSNSELAWEGIKSMEFWAANNLWHHPVTELADILMPAYHWMEVDHPRVSQGASGAIGANVRCIEPPVDCRYDPDTYTQICKAMGKPWYDPQTFLSMGATEEECPPVYPTNEEKLDVCLQVGAMGSGYGMVYGSSWKELAENFQENGWWDAKKVAPDNWGTYHRWETGKMRQRAYGTMNDIAQSYGFGFLTATSRMEFWPVSFETIDINNPDQGTQTYDDIMPHYYESLHTPRTDPEMYKEYPFIVTTGRRIPVYFHSEHRQLPWCREQWPAPRMEINPEDAEEQGIEQGDWVWIETPWGKIRETADLYYGIAKGTINLEHAWWFPELSAPRHGEKLCNCNQLVDPDNQDPIIGSSTLRAYLAKIYKATPENSPFGNPVPCDDDGTEIIHDASDPRLKEWLPDYEIREEE